MKDFITKNRNNFNAENLIFSSKLKNLRRGDTCKYVGQGVLSKIVVFAGKLFANIAGQSAGSIKDLVSIEAAAGGTSSYRSSWRQNY